MDEAVYYYISKSTNSPLFTSDLSFILVEATFKQCRHVFTVLQG